MPVLCNSKCGKNAILKVICINCTNRNISISFAIVCLHFHFNDEISQFIFVICFQRPKTGDALCKECFYTAFENEIHCTIQQASLFKKGDRVAVAASGGKDSTVLAYVLKLLNEKHNYGLKLILLSIDEGITG